MRVVPTVALAAGLIAAAAVPAAAQDLSGRTDRAAIDGVEFAIGVMDFDLSGTGLTMPVVGRGAKALTRGLAIEFGVTFATPEQQFGPSQLLIPEAHLSYAWRFGRLRPFVSGGGGSAVTWGDAIETSWRLSLSGGGGARFDVSDRLHVLGEMRLRGLTRNFSGSTAEWLGGFGWAWR